jgi:hypothetical protein
LSLIRDIGDKNWGQKTISETIFVEYVEFLRDKKPYQRQILSLMRDKRDKYQRQKTIIRDKKLYFLRIVSDQRIVSDEKQKRHNWRQKR